MAAFLTSEQVTVHKKMHKAEKRKQPSDKICVFVKKAFGITYTANGMTSLLHVLNFNYKKPKQIPGKADSKAQQEFIDRYENLKQTKRI